MYVFGFDVETGQVFVQFLGHALGQRRHQHPVALLDPLVDLMQQVIDLVLAGADLDGRIEQARGPHHLFHHHALTFVQFIIPGRSGYVDRLVEHGFKFMEVKRTVIQGRRQAEAIIHQHEFAAPVPAVHAAHLRYGLVALVDHAEKILWEIIEQAEGPVPGGPPVKES